MRLIGECRGCTQLRYVNCDGMRGLLPLGWCCHCEVAS